MKLTVFFTLLISSFSLLLTAQGGFSITISNTTYQTLENSEQLNKLPWDNETFQLAIPFEFQFLYQPFDKILIKDGKLSFDSYNWISPFAGVDLEDKGNVTTAFESKSPISSVVVDEFGLQILKIEFKNVGFYNGSYTDVTNFQVWLYSNNVIEFRYGNSQIASIASTFDKFTGPIIGIFNEKSDGLEGWQILGNNNFIKRYNLDNSEETIVNAFQDIPETGMVVHFEPEENDISAFVKKDKDLIESLPIQPLEKKDENMNEEDSMK